MTLETIRAYIIDEFLPGQDPAGLALDQRLLSTGIIDSVGAMKLLLFLEQSFSIEIDAEDIGADQLDTLRSIVALVNAKSADRAAAG